jgi:glycosyltransferase involved in cell wall biosynthesis
MGRSVQFAFVSFPVVAKEVIPILRIFCPWARVIFDTVDLHFLRVGREAELRDSPSLRRDAAAMREVEFSCMRMADVTLTVSEEERALLLGLLPDVVVEILPNIFEMSRHEPPGLEARQGLMFLGGFQHLPNIDGIGWFMAKIWPLLRARRPDLTLCIVGSSPTAEILALGAVPGVEVLGYVEDLAPVYGAARVCVAPLRYGAGMKGKVGQSMAYGLPVVTTSIGAEGMGVEDGVHLLVADAAESFGDSVLTLLDDDALWRRLRREGRLLVERTLSEPALAHRVAELFRV